MSKERVDQQLRYIEKCQERGNDAEVVAVARLIGSWFIKTEQELVERTVQRDAWINYAFVGTVVPERHLTLPAGEKRLPTALETAETSIGALRTLLAMYRNPGGHKDHGYCKDLRTAGPGGVENPSADYRCDTCKAVDELSK